MFYSFDRFLPFLMSLSVDDLEIIDLSLRRRKALVFINKF